MFRILILLLLILLPSKLCAADIYKTPTEVPKNSRPIALKEKDCLALRDKNAQSQPPLLSVSFMPKQISLTEEQKTQLNQVKNDLSKSPSNLLVFVYSSDSTNGKRESLARVLTIRQELISMGVDIERTIMKPMGFTEEIKKDIANFYLIEPDNCLK